VLLLDGRTARLSAGETPRYVRDFPAESGRYVVDAAGYHSVIVNGQTLLRDGADTGRRPGVVLRSTGK
jgi:N-acyl-D-aspartate/D-glutamate deacylase